MKSLVNNSKQIFFLNSLNTDAISLSTFTLSTFCLSIVLFSLSALSVANSEIGVGEIQFSNQNNQPVEAILLNAKAHINVTGLSARVSINQTYKNTSNDWVEAIYLLPLPENAAIDTLRIKTKGSVIEGVIKEKQKAQKIYQKAKQEGRKTALVNSERPNLFTTKVANIAPNSEVNIEVSYLQSVYFDNHIFSLSLPNTHTPRYIPRQYTADELELENKHVIATSGWTSTKNISPAQIYQLPNSHNISITATIHSGISLSFISSSSHKITWNRQNENYQIKLQKGTALMNRDFVLSWQANSQATPVAAVFSERVSQRDLEKVSEKGSENNSLTAESTNYLNIMVMPPQSISADEVLAKEMIFVIDKSGSMQGQSMRQAKASLNKALELLTPQDKFNIIEFDSTTSALFIHSKKANSKHIGIAKQFVQYIDASGGTEIMSALELALSSISTNPSDTYLKQIIFITDGSIGNEQEILQMIQSQLGDTRLFTIAIGSAPNTFFMRKTAQLGRGTFTHIANMQDIEKNISQLFKKLKNPVLKDIAIHWGNGNKVEFYPNPIPDLYLGEPVLIHAKVDSTDNYTDNYTEKNANTIIVKGTLKNKPWSRTITYKQSNKVNGISKIWARNKIEHIMDKSVLGLSENKIKEQVLPLALRFGLVSKYTSLVAVDKQISRANEDSVNTHRIKNLMPKGSTMQVPYPRTATNAELFRLSGLLLILLAITLYIKARKIGLNK
jgi:Ca-activated chloride channel homolog